MIIDGLRYAALKEVLFLRSRQKKIKVEELNSLCDDKKTFGVNWAAFGAVDADRAEEYAQAMQTEARLAKFLNAMEITVDRTIPTLDGIPGAQQYNKAVAEIKAEFNKYFN